ncbi:ABC transporter permease [Parabacteroides bouchesdurhonensis]|uniref:ABC transporter permease n=1 Tax=Parabacteroides bouchesdurhonensis TaxID=1936995 RepID=UPI000E53663F|nr:ABC transporter permease [Parabacteroides bouchesdurhonensis]RHJ94866.1 ABC transporter permease [Bacteroides sp. AM07-16]
MKTIVRNFISVLRRFKMATTLNILGLSVAFAAFMIIMMQVDYDRTFDRFHKDARNIYRVELQWEGDPFQAIFARPMADVFIRFSPHIKAGALTRPFSNETLFTVEKNGQKESYLERDMAVYPSFTDVFTFDMTEGSEKALNEPDKVLIPESLSRKIFGEESAIGKILETGEIKSMFSGAFKENVGARFTVGGVYKDFPKNSIIENVIYTPMDEQENLQSWGNSSYYFYIRLDSPESSKDLVNDFLAYYKKNELGKNLSWYNGEINFRLVQLPDVHFTTDVIYDSTPKSNRQTMWILVAIAIVILVIAGINFTNFSMALTPMRIRSINTQKVLGGSGSMLRFSLLTEAVCISIVAFLLALWMVYSVGISSLAELVDANVSLAAHPELIAITAFIAIFAGLLAGYYPSCYITSFPPALVLKGTFGLSPQGRVLRNVLISIQFFASFALIIGAMFMYLQNRYMSTSPLGYEKDQIIVTNVTQAVKNSKSAFVNQVKSFSGIEDVTFAEMLLSSQDQYMGWGRELNGKNIQFQCLPVDASFLNVMGIKVSEGREFRNEDELTNHGAFIFNERGRDVFDIQLGDRIDDAEIIGFIPDVKFASFRMEVTPMAFYLWGKDNWGNGSAYAYIKVKAGSDMRAAMQKVQDTLKNIDPDYPFNVRFFDEVLNSVYAKEKKLSMLITLFSLIAVFISIVGVFGLVVFESQYRRKEIGLRKVMGSTTSQILVMFNKTYCRILLICFILAAPVAYYAISRWLENFAYKTPIYGWVFIVAFLLVAMITIITVTFQNWRAASENPVDSIKTE